VLRHQRDVWLYLRSAGCDPATAEDLSQEVFLVALRKDASFGHDSAARAYLRQTARYLLLQRWRARRGGFEIAVDEAALDALDQGWHAPGTDSDWLEALAACVEQLRGRRRRAVELFYFEGKSRDAVGQALDMKPNGVKTLLQRVRADLKLCVERQHP